MTLQSIDESPLSPADLLARRLALGLSREQLAVHLDTTATTIYRWESGRHAISRPKAVLRQLRALARSKRRKAPKA